MRTPVLRFLEGMKTENSPARAFWNLDGHDIPEAPGVYILLADTYFQYPSGRSPVFYIGQSSNLAKRLREHRAFATQVRDNDRRLDLYWPRYEYAGRFGKSYTFLRTWQNVKPKALEDDVMACFALIYRSFPVANSAGAWNRISKHFADIA